MLEGGRLRDGDGGRVAGTAVGVVDGRVVAIGSVGAVRCVVGRDAEHVRMRDGVVLPGLVDPHVHVTSMATHDVGLDVSAATTVADVLRRVARHAQGLPRGAWVRGVGLDEAMLARFPTAGELEHAAAGRPVRLRHRSGHASVLSRSAWARARRVLPAGVWRDDGLVVGREAALTALVGPVDQDAFERGLARTSMRLLMRGVTCVGDASPRSRGGARRLSSELARVGFGPRVIGMGRSGDEPWDCGERLRYWGVKLLIEDDDGGLRPRPATLQRRIVAAARRGQRVAVHCVSLASLLVVIEAFAGLPGGARRGRRHRIEHLGECPPELLREIHRLGIAVVSNPSFLYWRGDVYRREASVPIDWLYRARSLLEARIPFAAASDAPVTPCDPWGTMAAARERRTRRGATLGTHERIGASAALAAVCRTAASVVGRSDLGWLRVGAPADLVVVDRDPVTAAAGVVRGTVVLATVVDGVLRWRR